MQASNLDRAPARPTFVQVVVAIAGAFNLVAGLALIFAPDWFFATLGNFPPFNRHYLGDVGAFLLPLGIGLLVAARDPAAHRLLIGVAAAGSLIHTANHLYDDFLTGQPPIHFLSETVPLLTLGVALGAAYWRLSVSAAKGSKR